MPWIAKGKIAHRTLAIKHVRRRIQEPDQGIGMREFKMWCGIRFFPSEVRYVQNPKRKCRNCLRSHGYG